VQRGPAALQRGVEQHDLPRALLERLEHLLATGHAPCDRLVLAAQFVHDQIGVAGLVFKQEHMEWRPRSRRLPWRHSEPRTLRDPLQLGVFCERHMG